MIIESEYTNLAHGLKSKVSPAPNDAGGNPQYYVVLYCASRPKRWARQIDWLPLRRRLFKDFAKAREYASQVCDSKFIESLAS